MVFEKSKALFETANSLVENFDLKTLKKAARPFEKAIIAKAADLMNALDKLPNNDLKARAWQKVCETKKHILVSFQIPSKSDLDALAKKVASLETKLSGSKVKRASTKAKRSSGRKH